MDDDISGIHYKKKSLMMAEFYLSKPSFSVLAEFVTEMLKTIFAIYMYCSIWTDRAEQKVYHSQGPKVIKLFSCSTQLSMKFSLLINMKMPTKVGIFIFISRENFMLSYVRQEKSQFFVI